MRREELRLYLVTDRPLAGDRDILDIVKQAVEGGATMVQLREKDADTRDFVELAIAMKKALEPYGVPLIINDRVDVALACDADGVHIGQSDMPYAIARKLLGPDKIIGLSVENMEQVVEANELDVDYIGVSPIYSTTTKTDTAAPFGLEGLAQAVKLSRHPSVAIGGMNARTAADVMRCGTDGIAVVSAIVCAPDPCAASRELLGIVNDAAPAPQKWTERIWAKAQKLYGDIIGLPFIKDIADGSLTAERFSRYIAQDEIYLRDYADHMFAVADMIPDEDLKQTFVQFAKDGLEGEKAMHELLIERFGMELDVPSSFVTSSYNHRIMSGINTGVLPVAFAAILPCMWIYNEVGLHILKIAKLEGNPYKEWIQEYGNEAFTKGVEDLLKVIDKYAAEASEKTLIQMDKAFLDGTLMEYAFWDYGYRGDEGSYEYIK